MVWNVCYQDWCFIDVIYIISVEVIYGSLTLLHTLVVNLTVACPCLSPSILNNSRKKNTESTSHEKLAEVTLRIENPFVSCFCFVFPFLILSHDAVRYHTRDDDVILLIPILSSNFHCYTYISTTHFSSIISYLINKHKCN